MALRVLLAVAALLLLLRHAGQLENNPLVRVPASDARAAWEHAGRIAAGELVGDEPRFAASLSTWLLAGVRAAGGGIAAALLRLQRVDEAAESAARATELDPGLAARLSGPLR
ncbi:MAG: hypothetical protein FJ296_10625, partial [Planctomycetes bacterium]|nr:hypothetical protein [Planctomycetota bacterium]